MNQERFIEDQLTSPRERNRALSDLLLGEWARLATVAIHRLPSPEFPDYRRPGWLLLHAVADAPAAAKPAAP